MEALLEQYQDPSANSFVLNFTIIYLKMGFPRLPLEEKVQLIPSIFLSLNGKPSSHQESFLTLVLPWLEHVKAPTDNPGFCLLHNEHFLESVDFIFFYLESTHYASVFHSFLWNRYLIIS